MSPVKKPLTMIGVPIDCSGRLVGVERMPAALRAAGLPARLQIEDRGDLPVTLDDPDRDPQTGIIAFQQVCSVSETIQTVVAEMLRRGERPLVVGGCCTLLIGVGAALKRCFGRVGLAFVDGHLDFYDGTSSLTGEAADMELAILTGLGPAGLVDLAGQTPLLAPADIVVLGARDATQAEAEGAPNPTQLIPEMAIYTPEQLRQASPAVVGGAVANYFAADPGRFWLHLDLDVLDQSAMPAVDYLMPGGLDWEETTALLRPLAASPALLGVDVTILNPTLDPTGDCARRTVELLADLFL